MLDMDAIYESRKRKERPMKFVDLDQFPMTIGQLKHEFSEIVEDGELMIQIGGRIFAVLGSKAATEFITTRLARRIADRANKIDRMTENK